MVLDWLHGRRDRDAGPLPEEWEAICRRNVAHYARLDDEERARLASFIRGFLRKKNFEGCGGLELDDEIRITIACLAGMLVLGLPHDHYRNVQSILVYPRTVRTPERAPGSFEVLDRPVATGIPILGEAQLRGPVILVWDAVQRHARHPEAGHNVVYHEFAHKLDMLDGSADGTPPIGSRADMKRWVEVCERAFLELRERVGGGKRTFLDAYGATNEAEFFAVATEYFFDRPIEMEREETELYSLLRDFYNQDPAERERAGSGAH